MVVEWSVLKGFVDTRKLSIQSVLSDGIYHLKAFDESFQLEHRIIKQDPVVSGSDQEDWETNYLSTANQKLNDKDIDSRNIVRIAAANKGAAYKAHFFEFETSKLASLYCKDWEDVSDPDITIKFYNSSNVELTTQASLDTDCVKTVITFAPGYDYEVISGSIHTVTQTTNDIRLWLVGGALELGAAGTKEFVRGLNLKFISADEMIETDGRASKWMATTTTGVPYNTNQLQVIVRNDIAGDKHKIMMAFEYFK